MDKERIAITGVFSYLYPFTVVFLTGWLGARLPTTDSSYLDLAHGRRVDESGRTGLPPVENISDSAAASAPWLGSWLLYRTNRAAGGVGLKVFAAALVSVGALGIYLTSPGSAGWLAGVSAVWVASPKMEISNSLFSWPLVVGALYALIAFRERSKWWALALPLLILSWAMLNREATVGLALVGLGVIESFVYWLALRRKEPTTPVPTLILTGSFVLAVLLVAVIGSTMGARVDNPLSIGLLMRETGASQWAPARFFVHPTFFLFAAVTGTLVGLSPRAPTLTEKAAMAGSALLSLVSGRFVVFFAAVSSPPAARPLEGLLHRLPGPTGNRFRPILPTALILALVGLVAATRLVEEPIHHRFGPAIPLIKDQHLGGSIFNTPEAGGLIGWELGPERVPFSDLRPASLARFRKRTGEVLEALESDTTHLALMSWGFALENLKPRQMSDCGFRLIYLDDSILFYARPASNPPAVRSLAFVAFDPLMEAEDYHADVLPLVTQEIFEFFKRHPPSARVLFKLASLLLREEKNEEALEVLEATRRLRPNDPRVWKELSRLYLFKGMFRLAEEAARRGRKLEEDEEILYYLASALYGQGRFREAAGWFETLLDREPENLSALRALVDIYRNLNEPAFALEYGKKLEALEQSLLDKLMGEATSRKKALDFSGAAAAYQEAHRILPADTEVLWNLAVVLLTEGRRDEAVAALRKIVERQPEHSLAHLTLGALCARHVECEPNEARRHLEEFLELAPADINADLARRELVGLAQTKAR